MRLIRHRCPLGLTLICALSLLGCDETEPEPDLCTGAACGGEDGEAGASGEAGAGGEAGASGEAGAGGAAGEGGEAGAGGAAGEGGEGGAAGDAGAAGEGGAAGDAGAAGAGGEPDPPAQRWQALPSVGAGPIQEVAVTALAGEVYVIGGFDGQGRVVPTVSVYDPVAASWRQAADLPVAMHHANAAAAAGRIWVLGFLRDRAFTEDGRGFVYDPDADTWSPAPEMPAGTYRGASGVAVIDDQIYLVGGLAGGVATSIVQRFDPADASWTPLPDLPAPRRDHMAAGAIGGRLIIAGGRDGRIGNHVPRVDLYDPATDAWTRGADMPTSRGGVAAAAWAGQLYVIGGEGDRSSPVGVFPQVEAYDLANDAWTSLADMPLPIHGTGAAALDGWIYVPGGADVQAFGAIDVNQRLRVGE